MRSAVTFTVEDYGVSGVACPLDTIWKAVNVVEVDRRIREGLAARDDGRTVLATLAIVGDFAALVQGGSTLDGFDMPSPSASEATLAGAFVRFADLNTDVADAWVSAYRTAQQPDVERKLLPPAHLTGDERNFTPPNDKPPEIQSSKT